jgi:hypothetical protein
MFGRNRQSTPPERLKTGAVRLTRNPRPARAELFALPLFANARATLSPGFELNLGFLESRNLGNHPLQEGLCVC